LDEKRKRKASKAIVVIAIQEFFFIYSKSTHNNELLKLMSEDETGIVGNKENIEDTMNH
jgi:hypothetical protein